MKSLFKIFIVLTSVVLIFSCGSKPRKDLYTIAIFQFSTSPYSVAVDGVVDALKEAGYIDGENCRLQFENAQGDFSTAQSIAQKLVNDKVDLIITSTTPCLQVTAMENKTIPHVFGTVTDPFRMGIAESPEEHQPNLTGIGTFQPVEETIYLINEIMPEIDNIGVIWNSAEACSEACTELMRKVTGELDLILTEVTVTNSSEVLTAAQSLVERKVDLIFVSGDNTVSAAVYAVILAANEGRIPVITNTPSDIEEGALLSLGADYYTVGLETGKMALRVIAGEKTSDMPIQKLVPQKLGLNEKVATELGITFTDEIRQKADRVLE